VSSNPTRLFSITRICIQIARVFNVVFGVGMVPVFFALRAGVLERMPNAVLIADPSPERKLFAASTIVVALFIGSILLAPLLKRLLAIVDSARTGDPFVPENGQRLRHIGWLLLAIYVVWSVALSVALGRDIKLPPISFLGIVTVLMIFVIARIFETGSAMRAELKDTV